MKMKQNIKNNHGNWFIMFSYHIIDQLHVKKKKKKLFTDKRNSK
jgi:hypothetical protein